VKYKALLLDFYGTLVKEDDQVIKGILQTIAGASPDCSDSRQIGQDWSNCFRKMCADAYGGDFQTQRQIERASIDWLLDRYHVNLNADALAEEQFAYWRAPEVYDDARWFVDHCSVPICIVSNIDNHDLLAAFQHNGWMFSQMVTSEDCRSYKPRPEMFRAALKVVGCAPDEVLHIGDSLTSDIGGAQALGIATAWINRNNRPTSNLKPTLTTTNLRDLLLMEL
jgi:2-haloacid dehalogenase/putative hydrolase of the HAD superfamily